MRLACLLALLVHAPLALAQAPIERAEDIPPPRPFVPSATTAALVVRADDVPPPFVPVPSALVVRAEDIPPPRPVALRATQSARSTAVSRAALRRELAARRATNLARFRAYVARERYPVNSYRPGLLNVFIDAEGNICAAATLMTEDGLGDVVRAQASADNFVRLGDLRQGALYEWILDSGFTQEEIAAIQEPFSYETVEGELPSEDEKDRLRRRYGAVISELVRDRDRSLELAVDRLLAHRLASR